MSRSADIKRQSLEANRKAAEAGQSGDPDAGPDGAGGDQFMEEMD